MSLIAWIVLGLIAGFIASKLVNKSGEGLLMDIVLGIVGAVLLGLGRATGETIAVALVIGSSPEITSHLFATGYNMPSVIANQFGEAFGLQRAGLMGIGVLLFVLTIIINVIARGVVERSARRKRGA